MGNRAVIATENRDLEVYLHWNGGCDSVQCFLEYCRLKGYRPPEEDHYGWARLCQVIGNFFTFLPNEIYSCPNGADDGLSVGISPYGTMDSEFCDNGRYIIKGWRIIGRESGDEPYTYGEEYLYDPYDMLLHIDEKQPLHLGAEYIKANMSKDLHPAEDIDDDD